MTTRRKRFQRWAVKPGTLIVIICLLYVFGQSYRGPRQLVESQRHGCERGIAKELLTIKDDNIGIKKAREVAHDPAVPPGAAHANLVEAQEREAIREYRYHFVAPVNGGTLVCTVIYPNPSFKPW